MAVTRFLVSDAVAGSILHRGCFAFEVPADANVYGSIEGVIWVEKPGSYDVRMFVLGPPSDFVSHEAAVGHVLQGELDSIRGGVFRKMVTKNLRVRSAVAAIQAYGVPALRAVAEHEHILGGSVEHRIDVVHLNLMLFAVVSVLWSHPDGKFRGRAIVDKLLENTGFDITGGTLRGVFDAQASTLYDRVNKLLRDERFDQALECFQEAVALSPERAQGWNNLAWCRLMLKKDLQQALTDVERAISLAPRVPNMYDTRGKIRAVLGDIAGAREDESRVAQLRRAGEKDW